MVWPLGCVCHAVRAPGVKWTLLADRREAADGAATASMKTMPVNHSLGPGAVSIEFLVICISFSLAVDSTHRALTSGKVVEPRTRLTRRQFERRGSCLRGQGGIDNTCRVAAILRAVG